MGCLSLFGQSSSMAFDYLSNERLGLRLRELAEANPGIIRLKNLKEDAEALDFWQVEAGSGLEEERAKRPALLLVAGVEGNDLIGSSTVTEWIANVASKYGTNSEFRELLDQTTIYLFPRVNASGAGLFFAQPRRESQVNAKPVDDDHDGFIDEDGPEDLNGDGIVSWMRIEDVEGEFILDPANPRLMVKADKSKGERGRWRYLIEGRDNDGDEAWNEDGIGGVNYNRNFPYNYSFFGPAAGTHQVSEERSRTLADFIVEHPNIAVVLTFGAADNLVQTPKGEEPPARKPQNEIHKDDVAIYREIGKLYRDSLGLKKELAVIKQPGTFSDWMYFHRGRLSLAAQPWSPALQMALVAGQEKPKKTEKKDPEESKPAEKTEEVKSEEKPSDKPASDKPSENQDKRNEEERAFLKWLDENAREAFLEWTAFEHPDFPGKKTEIGGFAPFARTNPPRKILDELIPKHTVFLNELLARLPRLKIQTSKVKGLGNDVYELVVAIENAGFLPTALAQGKYTREVHPTRVTLRLDDAFILGGERITNVDLLEGSGGRKEVRYILHAPNQRGVELEVTSMLGGTVRTTIDLASGN